MSLLRTSVFLVACIGCGSGSPASPPTHGPPVPDGGTLGWTWRNVNLQGMGDVNGLVIHPDTAHAPNLVYARTNVGGVYRRDPSSPAWIPILDSFGPLQANAYYVESVAVDPSVADDVYVVVDGPTSYDPGCTVAPGQVLVSHDRGGSWSSTGGSFGAYVFSNDGHGDTSGERLAVDPNKQGLLFFASHEDGLWRGSGGTWTNAVGAGLPAASCPQGCNLTCDPTCPLTCFAGDTFVLFDGSSGTLADGSTRRLFVGSWTAGVFVSDDGGQTFSPIGADIHPVRGSVGVDGTLYVSFGQPEAPPAGMGGVRAYRQGESGAWTDTDITPPAGTGVNYSGISADPSRAGTVVVTTNDARIFRSTDAGASWTTAAFTIGSEPPWYWNSYWYRWGGALVVDPNDNTGMTVWRTDGFAVSRTTDVSQGVWSTVMEGLEELVGAVVRTPGAGGGPQFYAGVADALGFADHDRTRVPSAKLASPGGDVAEATGFDVCASHPQFAAFVGWDEQSSPIAPVTGITSDGGVTFSPFASTAPGYGGSIAIASNDPTNLVWEPANGGALSYSTDGGQTWNPSALVTESAAPGASFYRASQWFNGQTVASDRVAPNTFYYLSQSQGSSPTIQFWSSTDGGKTFQELGAPLGDAPLYTLAPMIKPNPSTAGDVWVTFGATGGNIGGLYRTTDSGRSFARVASVGAAYQVAFGKGAAAAAPAIYLFGRLPGSTLDTMFLSNDLGQTWSAISDPSVNGFGEISYLEGDMTQANLVYVALAGRGIMYGVLGSDVSDAGVDDSGNPATSEASTATDAGPSCPTVAVSNPAVTTSGTAIGTTLMFGSGTDAWSSFTYEGSGQTALSLSLTPDTAGMQIAGGLVPPIAASANYNGAGLFYYGSGCLDASAYTGVTLDFSGSLGGCSLALQIGFAADADHAYSAQGQCTSASSSCYGPFADITAQALAVTPAAPTIQVPFSTLTGGMPVETLDPTTVLSLSWQLAAPLGQDAGGCSASFAVENVSFYK